MKGGNFTTFELVDAAGERRTFGTCGRFAQTLRCLIAAGDSGITSLEVASWALRLAHYVFRLRKDHGLVIETVREEHRGEFSGTHGRYILRDKVRVLEHGDLVQAVYARIEARDAARSGT